MKQPAEGSENILNYFLEEGKCRLQEDALDRAIKKKTFFEAQTRKTVDARGIVSTHYMARKWSGK